MRGVPVAGVIVHDLPREAHPFPDGVDRPIARARPRRPGPYRIRGDSLEQMPQGLAEELRRFARPVDGRLQAREAVRRLPCDVVDALPELAERDRVRLLERCDRTLDRLRIRDGLRRLEPLRELLLEIPDP